MMHWFDTAFSFSFSGANTEHERKVVRLYCQLTPLNNQYHSTHAYTPPYHSYLVAANTINFSQWVTYRMEVLLTRDSIQIKVFSFLLPLYSFEDI